MRFSGTSVLVAGLVACAVAATSEAARAAEDYGVKTINIVIGNAVGGGYDLYARLLARHLPRHLAGVATVTPVNMTGGGGMKSTNYLANAAPKDGSYLGMIPPSIALEPLFGDPNAKFKTMDFAWIGNMSRDVSSCFVAARSPVKSFADLKTREMTVGATGPAAQSATHAFVLSNMLGAKVKVITGYRGTAEIRMAMEKGEVDGMCGFWLSAALGAQKAELERGDVRVLIQLGAKKEAPFGDAPSIYELAKTPEDRQVLDLIFGMTELNRPIGAPPGTAPAKVAMLRKAFTDTMRDPALLAEAAKLNLMLESLDGAGTEALFRRFASAPPEVAKRASAVIKR